MDPSDPTRDDASLLVQPAPLAVRRLCLGLAESACAAERRLSDPADREALHDFRVAVRRLRAALRAWRPVLGDSVHPADRRELRALQRATGRGRDLEVGLQWLAEAFPEPAPAEVVAFAARLEGEQSRPAGTPGSRTRKRFRRRARKLARRLARVRLDLRKPEDLRSYAAALADVCERSTADLEARLRAVAGANDRRALHRARIACKHLRYLCEPASEPLPPARALVAECRALQDLLGDLNDAFVLLDDVEAEGGARELPLVAERIAARRDQLFAVLSEAWLGKRSEVLLDHSRQLVSALRDGGPLAPVRDESRRAS